MQENLTTTILSHIHPGMAVGLVGLGAQGLAIRALLEITPGIRLLLCDPAAAVAEADDLSGDFFALWGNGMGGCQLTGEELEAPLLPPERLAAADALILCPLADSRDDAAAFPREAALLAAVLAPAKDKPPLLLSAIPANALFPQTPPPPSAIFL